AYEAGGRNRCADHAPRWTTGSPDGEQGVLGRTEEARSCERAVSAGLSSQGPFPVRARGLSESPDPPVELLPGGSSPRESGGHACAAVIPDIPGFGALRDPPEPETRALWRRLNRGWISSVHCGPDEARSRCSTRSARYSSAFSSLAANAACPRSRAR